jgi:hypothetical protein
MKRSESPPLGSSPRPRVGIIAGDVSKEVIDTLAKMFATAHIATSARGLHAKVYPGDLDLVIVWNQLPGDWGRDNHAIFFGIGGGNSLSGFVVGDVRYCTDLALGETFEAPPVHPLFASLQRAYVRQIRTARKRPVIRAFRHMHTVGMVVEDPETEDLIRCGILVASQPRGALAVVQTRSSPRLGFAWFPTPPEDPAAWTRSILMHWSAEFPDSFPGVNDWEASRRWSTAEERRLGDRQIEMETRRKRVFAAIEATEARLASDLLVARDNARNGPRRLITAQGAPLVHAVIEALSAFGFHVTDMDAVQKDPNEAKKEDLRIRCPDDPEWEAIVEVKGLERGNVRGEHLQKIARHVMRYTLEKQRAPSKQIFVCNGELLLPPELRHRPFAGSPDDARAFAENDGLVIPTTDLFEMRRDLGDTLSASDARERIKNGRGVLDYVIEEERQSAVE